MIFLALLAIGIIITIIINIQREKRFRHFDFPETMIVNNYTEHKRADTLAMVILNRILKYDTAIVTIYYFPREWGNDNYEISGFIQKNQFDDHPHEYIILIKKGVLPISVKKFLSHELIHLDQMEKGELIQIIGVPKVIYKGETIDMMEVPYDKRPYEQDAFARENGILKELNHIIYSK